MASRSLARRGGVAAGGGDSFTGETRYVNTASSAGGDGTTNNTSGATRAFAGLSEAILTLFPTEPTVLGSPYRILCSGTTADTTSLTQTTWNHVETTATNYLLIQGNNRSAKWDTTKYRLEVTDDSVIYNNHPAHLRLDALQGQVTSTDGSDYNVFRVSTLNVDGTSADCIVKNCIARGVVSAGDNNIAGFRNSPYSGGGGNMMLWNCIAFGCETGFQTDKTDVFTVNCTGHGNKFNFDAEQICMNCLSAADTGDIAGFLGVGTAGGLAKNNASDDGSAEGTNSRVDQTFTFVNTAGLDFGLQSGDAGAKNFGFTDPLVGLFSDDIAGTTRGATWSIGAHEPA